MALNLWAMDGAMLTRPHKLSVEPEDSSQKYSMEYPEKEQFFVLGYSKAKKWYRVLHPSGAAGWLPYWTLSFFDLSEEQQKKLNLYLARGMRPTYRWIFNGGMVWATDPFHLGYGGEGFINLRRKGLMGKNYDQFEVGSGFYYHLSSETIYQIPVTAQWFFKVAYNGEMLMGPFWGFALAKDPRFRFDHALPVRVGIGLRHYWNEDWGYFVNAGILWRSKKNPFIAGGLSLRL